MTERREEYRTADFDPRSVAITRVLDDARSEQTIGALRAQLAALESEQGLSCATCRLGQDYCPIRFVLWQRSLIALHDRSFGCTRWEALEGRIQRVPGRSRAIRIVEASHAP